PQASRSRADSQRRCRRERTSFPPVPALGSRAEVCPKQCVERSSLLQTERRADRGTDDELHPRAALRGGDCNKGLESRPRSELAIAARERWILSWLRDRDSAG